jgi:predicted GNAT family acetyltransferase
VPDQSAASYEALRPLAGAGGTVGLFFTEPAAQPKGWTILRSGLIDQMVCLAPPNAESAKPEHEPTPRRLTAADVPAMLELAALTEPGPFGQRTIELGAFFGIFDAGRLLSMAGQRLRLPGFIEVSAVCTHPDARGRGYARILMARVMDEIRKSGETPFLHVLSENATAISVYQSLGFVARRTLHFAILRNDT